MNDQTRAADGVLDREKLLGLRDLQQPGEPDVLHEMIRLFLDDSATRLARARTAFDRGDAPDLQRVAHSLRGSAGLIGAAAVADASKQLERLAAAGDLAAAGPVVGALADALETTFARLTELRAAITP